MGKTDEPKRVLPLPFDGNNIFVWLLQSSVVVALVGALLFAFGANFDYRLRWEFGMQNIQFVRSTSDITYDGLIIVSAWFKTFQPYVLAAISSLIFLAFWLRLVADLSAGFRRSAKILLWLLLFAVSGLVMNSFLQSRATRIASVIKERAIAGPQALLMTDSSSLEGYVISSSEDRTAFLTKSGMVMIVAAKDVQSLRLSAK